MAFSKENGRIVPRLKSADCIELQINSSRSFEPGDISLTFSPEVVVNHNMLEGQLGRESHQDNELADSSNNPASRGHPENNKYLEMLDPTLLQSEISGQNTFSDYKESLNASLAFSDSETSSNW